MTLSATISATGATAPTYAEVLAGLQASFRAIYGSDVNLDPDTQDGQLVAVFAQVIHDCNQAVIAAYNAFSPSTAQGAGLSSVTKINGLARKAASNSTATVTIVGTVGTVIASGVIGDNLNLGTKWNLPNAVTIPASGTIDVTATCSVAGAVTAGAGTLTKILTPTLGWTSVTNAVAAAAGAAVESDAGLRKRQSASTAKRAQTKREALYAAIAALPGVTRLAIYENPTAVADSNGIPSHSICAVVDGGSVTDIAAALAEHKIGTGTYGSTTTMVADQNGVSTTINHQPLAKVPMKAEVTIKAMTGYTSTIGESIKAAVIAFGNVSDIGESSYLARLYTPANLGGVGDGATFRVIGIRQARDAGALAAADVAIAFTEAQSWAAGSVSLVVT